MTKTQRMIRVLRALRGPNWFTVSEIHTALGVDHAGSQRSVARVLTELQLEGLAEHRRIGNANRNNAQLQYRTIAQRAHGLPVEGAAALTLFGGMARQVFPRGGNAALPGILDTARKQCANGAGLEVELARRIRFLDANLLPAVPTSEHVLEIVKNALGERRALSLAYRADGEGAFRRALVLPQCLCIRGSEFFLVATLLGKPEVAITIPLHEIGHAHDAPNNGPDVAFDVDVYLSFGAGVVAGRATPVDVRLQVAPSLAAELARCPPDGGRVLEPLDDGGAVLTIRQVAIDCKIVDALLARAPALQVLAPLWLRDAIVRRIEAAAAAYPRNAR
jgi:predicted DNA-binding transcriptional regulator YafY